MNIRQDCFIELLQLNGLDCLYIDNYYPGKNIYFFGGNKGATLTLTDSCLSNQLALYLLDQFSIKNSHHQLSLVSKECDCE